MAEVRNTKSEDADFASPKLESGKFEMKKEPIKFSTRLSLISLGLNIRSQKLYSRYKESRRRYITEQSVGLLSLIVFGIVVFSILSYTISKNASRMHGKVFFIDFVLIQKLRVLSLHYNNLTIIFPFIFR